MHRLDEGWHWSRNFTDEVRKCGQADSQKQPRVRRCFGDVASVVACGSWARLDEASKCWCHRIGYRTILKGGEGCRAELLAVDVDGCDIPWYVMYGTILANIDTERILEKADRWASYMAWVRPSGPSYIYIVDVGVMLALRSGADVCVRHEHNDAGGA